MPLKESNKTDTDDYDPFSDSAQTISLSTITGEYVLKSPEAEKIVTLIENNVEGLRQRSVFATAQQDSSKSGKSLQDVQYP